jgi:hypothetical protein
MDFRAFFQMPEFFIPDAPLSFASGSLTAIRP